MVFDYVYVGMFLNLYIEVCSVVLVCYFFKDLIKFFVCDNIFVSCLEIVFYDSCRFWIVSDFVEVGLSGFDVCDLFNESVVKIWWKEFCNLLKE